MLKDNQPWLPPKTELPDASAIQALHLGEATPEQQQRALKWIIENLCATYQPSYRPGVDGDRQTAFAEGRRYPGLHIVELLHVNLKNWRTEDAT